MTSSGIDIFISRDHGGSRVYFAGTSWCPPMLRDRLDAGREAWLTNPLDLDDLDRHMWDCDAPYEKRVTLLAGVELRARGRSAIMFSKWLDGLLRS